MVDSVAPHGLHHVTAIAEDPQRNVDFYTTVLGLRLVKRTVNFDAPETYHLYYGDASGRPSTLLTFFPWPGAPNGKQGTGLTTATAFSVPPESLGWWQQRLLTLGVDADAPVAGSEEEVLDRQYFTSIYFRAVSCWRSRPTSRASPWMNRCSSSAST